MLLLSFRARNGAPRGLRTRTEVGAELAVDSSRASAGMCGTIAATTFDWSASPTAAAAAAKPDEAPCAAPPACPTAVSPPAAPVLAPGGTTPLGRCCCAAGGPASSCCRSRSAMYTLSACARSGTHSLRGRTGARPDHSTAPHAQRAPAIRAHTRHAPARNQYAHALG